MRKFAPFLTLLAVAVLGVALLAANIKRDPANQQQDVTAAAGATAPDPAVPPPATAAPATVPPPPEAPQAVAQKAYAGRSSGNEVTVAVAVKDGKAVAYVCDGKKIEAWLEGTVTDGKLALKGKDATLEAAAGDKAALGNVTVAGKQWPFAAQAVAAPGGLYEARADVRGVISRIGWIVEGDGRVTGGSRGPNGEFVPAPSFNPNDPDATTADGRPVDVSVVDAGATVVGQ
jgi:hypothetical protein